jgi:hypothetical protein
MKYRYNPITGLLDLSERIPISSGSTYPTNPVDGDVFINLGSGSIEVYYGGVWYVIYTIPNIDLNLLRCENGDDILLEDGTDLLALNPV